MCIFPFKARRFLKSTLLSSGAILACASYAQNVQAAGFYLQEQSVSGLGAAFAGQAAMPRDASTVYFNPAGMTHLPGANLNAGVHIIIPNSELTDRGSTLGGGPVGGGDGGNPYDPTPLPNLYFTQQVTDNFWLGIGAGAPFGLGNEYDSDWFGRYESIKSELTTFEIYPSAAIKFNDWLSVGGSLIFNYSDATLTNALNAGTQGLQTLEGDGYAFGYNIGILVEPRDGTRIGMDYRSSVNNKLEGRFSIVGSTGGDTDVGAQADLHLPDIASLSAAQDLNDRWTLLGSATWFGWNDFDRIETVSSTGTPIGSVEQNYNSSWAFAIGAEYQYSDAWTLRAGYQFDETPTNDEFRTTRTPDGDRHWLTGGATYQLNDKWSFDFAGAYIDVAEEEVNLNRNITAIPAVVNAETDGYVVILAAGLNYKF